MPFLWQVMKCFIKYVIFTGSGICTIQLRYCLASSSYCGTMTSWIVAAARLLLLNAGYITSLLPGYDMSDCFRMYYLVLG
jgi:hypothetical protein